MTRKVYNCTECGLVCETDQGLENHMVQHYSGPVIKNKVWEKCDNCDDSITEENLGMHTKSKHSLTQANAEPESTTSEDYVVKGYHEKEESEEDILLNNIFGGKNKETLHEGITMKGKSLAFKDACILVKTKLTKGRALKDNKERQMKILNEKADGALEVEVETLSKKLNKKRGCVQLHMYKPNRSRKKECSILISRFSGHDIVFVKTLMEMFIQPMIDCALKNPDKNPLECFIVKLQDKTIGKEHVTVKQEPKEDRVKCDQCDKIFASNKGYRIHVGRMHTVKLDSHVKRKRSDSEEFQNKETTCDACNS